MSYDAVIAANRFGLGARPGELQAAASDPRGWLREQIRGPRELPAEIRALTPSSATYARYEDLARQRRETREPAKDGQAAQRAFTTLREHLAPIYREQVAARYRVATHSRESFRERLVHFWTNHFAVSADKPQVLALAGALENEAIRPHLSGSFLDMLLAVESHPAMILYLDNQASVGPNSTLAGRATRRLADAERKIGLNENLAREILELHTLGVNGGYTQADVTAFARALTGWSIGTSLGPYAQGTPGKFLFRENVHEPGAQTILGKRYGESGIEQPRAILRDLARHPSTATHIAAKLVRHFVADVPPQRAVQRIAKTFRDTDGDLPSVHAALVDLREAWAHELKKLKTPHEFVVSTFRLFDFVPAQPQQTIAAFDLLGQRPYTPGSPAGWPDTADGWDGPDALMHRIEWASQISERVGRRFAPLELAAAALGDALSARTRQAIARAENAAQGITLLLASPEFQRR
ncbi:MAG TPA: DUF1800 domain-containing protein [Steroidobacteraceae bacterium]